MQVQRHNPLKRIPTGWLFVIVTVLVIFLANVVSLFTRHSSQSEDLPRIVMDSSNAIITRFHVVNSTSKTFYDVRPRLWGKPRELGYALPDGTTMVIPPIGALPVGREDLTMKPNDVIKWTTQLPPGGVDTVFIQFKRTESSEAENVITRFSED